jgi:hypothetical protein
MKHKKTKNRLPPFTPLFNETLDAPATRALSHGAFRLYVALKRQFNHKVSERQNGRIYLSQRDAQQEIGSNREEIARWYRELQHFGFIVMTTPGCLGLEGKGKAPKWRLTELPYMGERATNDFLRWNEVPFRDQKKQNPGPEKAATSGPEKAATQCRKWTGKGSHKERRKWTGKGGHTKSNHSVCCTCRPRDRRRGRATGNSCDGSGPCDRASVPA